MGPSFLNDISEESTIPYSQRHPPQRDGSDLREAVGHLQSAHDILIESHQSYKRVLRGTLGESQYRRLTAITIALGKFLEELRSHKDNA